ncbi:6-phosphofructokinase, partial [Psychrobacter sp. SIMBA_152]
DALDKIRDTAEAMDRVFIVEVMGRNAGYIGISSAMACGAERMILPELQKDKPLTVDALHLFSSDHTRHVTLPKLHQIPEFDKYS